MEFVIDGQRKRGGRRHLDLVPRGSRDDKQAGKGGKKGKKFKKKCCQKPKHKRCKRCPKNA